MLQGTESVTEEVIKPYPVGGCKEEEEEYDNVEDFHSCGIGRFRLFEDTLICVDGQQRLTTTSLLVAAIRDKAKALGEDILCKEANEFLLSTEKETPMDSTIHTKLRLLPSQPDREEFSAAVLGKPIGVDGHISRAFCFFSDQLTALLMKTQSGEDQAKLLQRLLQSSLHWMRMMAVEVKSDLSLCQWFLWLQEKSLFGFAALLMNNTPGVVFDAWDLAKNLLLSAFMERGMDEQEKILDQRWWRWVAPLMLKKVNLDKLLTAFLDSEEECSRHIGKYEKSILDMVNAASGESDEEDQDETISVGERGEEDSQVAKKSFLGSYSIQGSSPSVKGTVFESHPKIKRQFIPT